MKATSDITPVWCNWCRVTPSDPAPLVTTIPLQSHGADSHSGWEFCSSKHHCYSRTPHGKRSQFCWTLLVMFPHHISMSYVKSSPLTPKTTRRGNHPPLLRLLFHNLKGSLVGPLFKDHTLIQVQLVLREGCTCVRACVLFTFKDHFTDF